MCWKTRNIERTEKKISPESGVRVFKIVNLRKGKYIYAAYHRDFKYKLGKVAVSHREISFKHELDVSFVEEAIHSYLSDSVIVRKTSSCVIYSIDNMVDGSIYSKLDWFIDNIGHGTRMVVMEGIIPHGTPYYVNEYGEVISEKLLPTNVVELADYSVHVSDYMETNF